MAVLGRQVRDVAVAPGAAAAGRSVLVQIVVVGEASVIAPSFLALRYRSSWQARQLASSMKRRASGWISLRLSVTLPPVVACTHKSLVPSHVLADSIRTMLVLGMWHCTHSMALPLASCAWGESANSC